MRPRYEILSLDDLERLPAAGGSQTLLPLRRTAGFRPFGVNAWLGAKAGDHVIERHAERGGDEELYVVVRGRARFTVGDETVDAPPATLVHVPPGTVREAVAEEDDTIVLAAGAKPGEAWEPKPWEAFHTAFAYRAAGRVDEGRTLVRDILARHPGTWQGEYNAACFEALAGDDDAAFAHLGRAHERAPDEVSEYAAGDGDLARLRTDPRWREIFG
jgi:hypothetical protein